MNTSDLDIRKRKLQSILDSLKELKQGKDTLISDKQSLDKSRLASVKQENNQLLNQEEIEASSAIKENYPSFFEDEVEQSDPEIETTPEYKERKQLAQILEYIKDELNNNSIEQAKLIQKFIKARKAYISASGSVPESSTSINSQLTSQNEPADESSTSINSQLTSQIDHAAESSLKNSPSISQNDPAAESSLKNSPSVSQNDPAAESSLKDSLPISQNDLATGSSTFIEKDKKLAIQNEQLNKQNAQINNSTNDYIDSLPKEYNPFDDLGDD